MTAAQIRADICKKARVEHQILYSSRWDGFEEVQPGREEKIPRGPTDWADYVSHVEANGKFWVRMWRADLFTLDVW